MKLYIINPDYGISRRNMEERCELLSTYVGPDVVLEMDCLTETKVEINSASDVIKAGPEILKMGKAAEANGADAVILYCFSDPAIEALREELTIPVIGGAQASILLAPHITRHTAVLLADSGRIPEKEWYLRTLGVDASRISSVEAIHFHGVSIWDNRREALNQLIEKGLSLKENGAECIILGCLSFLGLAEPVEKAISIPVIDPAATAVAMAEAVVRLHLKTSKIAYPHIQ